mmetsp:Transcript_11300/g.18703  ORF Transcript_11300/g.18703 Transcript_11300/m.18703 type:complete len:112 (+) Transcript_11300:113-448(+)
MPCRWILLLWAAAAAEAFSPPLMRVHPSSSLAALAEKVEVCGFKDCKRAGGGPRLEKLIGSILEEKELAIPVEACECQGECGYGPNLVIDGEIVNFVKGREAVLQALGIEE